ncbi:hypothetical protein SDC9_21767 [bioreactor metagenome]|uniref:Peptidase M50 domain-containing protein n=1 Tax=bioreactor metagenome TaxID=1076179 RepID=A0A644UAN4_9ZZZZ|nr:site-2 protease family protein [Candidatus Elulimicrobiales bacterium]
MDILFLIFFFIIIFYSIILHEIAHGYAAYRNGDATAYNAGRLTLNPISHIDAIGSIVVPIFSYLVLKFPFGWAKPVPYNPNNIQGKKYAELEISAAGILTNFTIALLAVVVFYILRFFGLGTESVFLILQTITSVNLFLGLFNLLPFPPADGFSVFTELFSLAKDFWLKIKNSFSKKKEYEVRYMGKTNSFKNTSYRIKALFSNPLMMIIIIIVAVNIFQLLVPYIMSFINFLYSF